MCVFLDKRELRPPRQAREGDPRLSPGPVGPEGAAAGAGPAARALDPLLMGCGQGKESPRPALKPGSRAEALGWRIGIEGG